MSRAILMSIRPQHVCNILNELKTLEIRKRFPSDYVGWVYVYCTKDSKTGWCMVGINENETYYQKYDRNAIYSAAHNYIGNGKVVARFWCDKVEEINNRYCKGMLIDSCLTNHELNNYLGNYQGYAIHITNLEIFDKPKEAGEFLRPQPIWKTSNHHFYKSYQLNRAPQSWCYVEV